MGKKESKTLIKVLTETKLRVFQKEAREKRKVDEFLHNLAGWYEEKGTRIYAQYSWINDGAREQSLRDTESNWYKAKLALVKKHEGCTLEKLLEDYTHWQRAIINHHENKDDPSFLPAEKYVGFIIASYILEKFPLYKTENKESIECWDCYLAPVEYEYLQRTSVEDYIKISAYLKWRKESGDANSNYQHELSKIINIKWPCKNSNNIDVCKHRLSMNLKNFIKKTNNLYHNAIKRIAENKELRLYQIDDLETRIRHDRNITMIEFLISKCFVELMKDY